MTCKRCGGTGLAEDFNEGDLLPCDCPLGADAVAPDLAGQYLREQVAKDMDVFVKLMKGMM